MFTLLNFVTVLPPACVEFVEHSLRDTGIDSPVILREQPGKPGFVCMVGWGPEQGPTHHSIRCELLVCPELRPALCEELKRFHAMTRQKIIVEAKPAATAIAEKSQGKNGSVRPEIAAEPDGQFTGRAGDPMDRLVDLAEKVPASS